MSHNGHAHHENDAHAAPASAGRLASSLLARWLGVGLAAVVATSTLVLAATGQLGLYVNPDSSWFVIAMSLLALVGAALSFTVPLGVEAAHDHAHEPGDEATFAAPAPADAHHSHAGLPASTGHAVQAMARRGARPFGVVTLGLGAVVSTGVALSQLVLPAAALSPELAMSRQVNSGNLFADASTVALARSGDTSTFGIGMWAALLRSTTDPDSIAGLPATLVGFVTPSAHDPDVFFLTRLLITHCVIDAQSAGVPVRYPGWADSFAVGQWVQVEGEFGDLSPGGASFNGALLPAQLTPVDQPADPYEY